MHLIYSTRTTALPVVFLYFRHKYIVLKLIALQTPKYRYISLNINLIEGKKKEKLYHFTTVQ
jgi:hypothetical protein